MLHKMQKTGLDNKVNIRYIKNTVHNFYLYSLAETEQIAFSFGFDRHIPIKSSSSSTYTDFQHCFFKTHSRIFKTFHKTTSIKIKTNMRSTCQKYSQIIVWYEYRKIVKDLSNNNSIIILQKDKEKGVVIMDRQKYLRQFNLIWGKWSLIYPKIFTPNFSQADYHQPNFMAQIKRTSYRPMVQLMIYLFDQLFPTYIQKPTTGKLFGKTIATNKSLRIHC